MRNFTFVFFKILTAILFLLVVRGTGYTQEPLNYPPDGPGWPRNEVLSGESFVLKSATQMKSVATPLLTAIQTTDNEGPALNGVADGDLDIYLGKGNSPIEFNIFINDAVVTNARLSILAWDIDWNYYGNPAWDERDAVYVNDHFIGYLTGTNDNWSTTSFVVDPSYINPVSVNGGKNLIEIVIDVNQQTWALQVDWGQLSINEQTGNVTVSSATLNKSCFMPCNDVEVTVEVDADSATNVIVETVLADKNGNIVDQHDASFIATTGVELYTATLEAINCATLPGQDYTVKIFVYEDILGAKGIQLAYKEVKVPVCGCQKIFTSASLLAATSATGPWTSVAVDLDTVYNMVCLDPKIPFYYLDLDDLVTTTPIMEDTYNPFYLNGTYPIAFWDYWDAKGVNSSASGGWEEIMWDILMGTQPMFYVKFDSPDYQLIDGLQYLASAGAVKNPLRISGDYPSDLYYFTGTLLDENQHESCPMRFKMAIGDDVLPDLILSECCVYLTNDGKYTLNRFDKDKIVSGTSDNCTSLSNLIFDFSRLNFECADVYNKVPITVTATDIAGNISSGSTFITVLDTIKPIAKCQNVTTYLDSFGQAYVVQTQVNAGNNTTGAPTWAKFFENLHGGSYDNCEVKELHLSRQLFTCNDVGYPSEITLSVVDPSGNTGTCKSTITVFDTLVPVITHAANVSMTVAPGVCSTKVAYPEIVVKDNCTTTLVIIAGLGANSNFPLGTTVETWKATDLGGKSSTMSFNVTISTYNAAPAIASVADITVDEDAAKFDVPLSGIGYGIDCITQQITSLDVANSNTALLTVTKEYTNGAATGKLVVTPLANKNGVATITLTVKDNGGTANGGVDTTVKTFKINVNAVNDVPTVTPISDQIVVLPNKLSVNVVTPFKDVDEGDVLTFIVTKSDGSALPSWMTFSTSTGLLTGTPTTANLGWTEVKVVATDKAGATAQDVFLVVVTDPNASTLNVTAAKGSTPLTGGFNVTLFVKDGNFYKAVVNTPLFNAGTYTFYNLPNGTYLAKAVITDATMNPGLLNTYYESAPSVTGATPVVFSAAGTKTIQVKMQSSTLAAGTFKISGIVVYKTGTPDLIAQGKDPVSTPAAGVDLVLKQNNVIIASTQTGADGKYSFTNLPAGVFDVFVEVTGYTQIVTQKVTLDAANPLKDKVDFTIWTGSNSFVITNIKDLNNDFAFKLYPNPTSGKVNIEFTWNDMRRVDVMVYNILGVEVLRNQYTPGNQITFDMSGQVTGIYLVKINAEGQSIVRKLTLDKR